MGCSASSSSPYGFDKKTATGDVIKKLGTHARGKYIIITGGTGGLGFETARALAKAGAHVTVSCRSDDQGKAVVKKIEAGKPEGEIHYLVMDLSDLVSVKTFCESYLALGKPLHVLVNNAAIMGTAFGKTKQGFEMQLGVNHVGHFLLTAKLLPLLNDSGTPADKSRVINVASSYNWLSAPPTGVYFDDIDAKKSYHKWPRYGASKFANVAMAVELNRRCTDQGLNVCAVALHPGIILETGLMRHNSLLGSSMEQIPGVIWRGKIVGFLNESFKKTAQGAATQLLCVLDPKLVPGEWYVDCVVSPRYLHPLAKDPTTGKRLWQITEEMIQPYV